MFNLLKVVCIEPIKKSEFKKKKVFIYFRISGTKI